MSYSQVVADLMHKLTKNEVQYQEGGKRKHKSKSKKYFNQLNSLRGGGPDEDLEAVSEAIDQLVPKSWLDNLYETCRTKIDQIGTEKLAAETKITRLEAQLAILESGSTANTAELAQLKAELEAEKAKYKTAETELQSVKDILDKLSRKATEVKEKAKALLETQLEPSKYTF
jgi:chromosome segregation ATPase